MLVLYDNLHKVYLFRNQNIQFKTTIGNVGPGLGTVGSTGNVRHIPALGEWVLTAAMLPGRLEIYGLFIFFQPKIWRKRIKY